MAASDSHYVHGTHQEEQRRLSAMNDALNSACLDELRLIGGERVLDVGVGLGQLSRGMARRGAKVIGVERSAEQLAEARRLAKEAGEEGAVELRQGDAMELPLRPEEQGAFDLAHSRFLLEHLPDPLSVGKQMLKAVRPGGRVVLADDDHAVLRLWPQPPGVGEAWEAYLRTYDRHGNDPFIGRRLPELLYRAGAKPLRITWVFFGACAGQPGFDVYVQNFIAILRGARAEIASQQLVEVAAVDRACEEMAAWGQRPDAAFWYAMSWAEGARPS
jgi:SAM-dependent methyltransferase